MRASPGVPGLPAETVGQLDALFGQAPFGLLYLDGDLHVRWANQAYTDLSGRALGDVVGCTLDELYPDLDAETDELAHAVVRGEYPTGERLVRHREDPASGTHSYQLSLFAPGAPGLSHAGLMMAISESTVEVEASAQLAIATARLHLLSELGGQLSATLDVERILQLATELLTPVLGDVCAVDALDDDDPQARRVTRAVAAHGVHSPVAGAVVPPPQVNHALRSATLLRYQCVPAGLVEESERDLPGNAIVIPMHARGQVVGAVTLARYGSTRRYDDTDVGFAAEVAGRIAMAVDNARLYARQRDVAFALQHALLPQRMPELPGVDVAARYIAGSADTEVGGDWFDVTPLPDGRVALVIGDVMGRGVRAAAVMGQLRAAVRAYTVLSLSPSRLLAYLDRVVTSLDQVQLVTCLYGVLDPVTGEFSYAKAGHHPPMLRTADGTVATLECPDAPPLGLLDMARGTPRERTARIPPGGTLLLYTDGLVEERHVDIDVRQAQLAAGLSAATGRPEQVVDALLETMGRTGELGDDIALLAVRLPAVAEPTAGEPDAEAHFTVTGEPASVADARHFLAGVLNHWGLGPLVDTAALLVSETVTNALLHAKSAADVRVHRVAAGVEVEVRDLDERMPAPRIVDPDAESGRGLYLLDQLSAAWGAEPSYAGKRVWFRLDLPGPK